MSRHEKDISLTLFADNSDESREARRLVDELGMEHDEIPSSGSRVPAVEIGGYWFSTLDGVKAIVTALERVKESKER